MAKQKGIFQVEGTLDEVTFYRSQDGHMVRKKGGVNGDRIKSDPAFARTRENGVEFKNAAQAGKLMRHAFTTFVSKSADGRVTSRLVGTMAKIKNLDTTSARGERTVANGIGTLEGKAVLQGFNFNKNAVLDSVLLVPYDVDLANNKVTIQGFVPGNGLAAPSVATHFSVQAASGLVDFASGISVVELSNTVNGAIDLTSSNITLGFTAPVGTGTKVVMLHVEFFQEINGVQYSLKNGAYNALGVIDVA